MEHCHRVERILDGVGPVGPGRCVEIREAHAVTGQPEAVERVAGLLEPVAQVPHLVRGTGEAVDADYADLSVADEIEWVANRHAAELSHRCPH